MKKKFELGMIVVTDGAVKEICPVDVLRGIIRHAKGDWGDVNADSQFVAGQERALVIGKSVSSVYTDSNGRKFWVLTSAARSETRVMLPAEFMDLD